MFGFPMYIATWLARFVLIDLRSGQLPQEEGADSAGDSMDLLLRGLTLMFWTLTWFWVLPA